jgi:endoglycosylceramidase
MQCEQVVTMRGLNLASDTKLPPFMPIDDLGALNVFKIWGANLGRLAFIWEAFEPERGKYNMEYLNYYTGIIRVRHVQQRCESRRFWRA